MEFMPITITVNGERKEIRSNITILEYLHHVGLNVQTVACDLNGEIVKRRDFSSTNISDGDMLEIVNFVGGG